MSMEDREFNFGKNTLSLKEAVVMGVINLSPDSFYAESRFQDPSAVIERTAQMLQEGMQILDLGGQSTRPGARAISAEEELGRLLPALKAVRGAFPELLISVDTFLAAAAEAALAEGADIINDISGGASKELLEAVSRKEAGYVLMHIQGSPENMQKDPRYRNARSEVFSFLEERAGNLREMGIKKLFIDPGFGFGKTLEQNYELLFGLNKLSSLPYPVLAGLSRKSMITKVLNVPAEEALTGTSLLNWIALSKGARILRVHDVRAAAEVIKLFTFTRNLKLTGI